MMESPQKAKIPVKERDPVNSVGDRGTDSSPQNNSHEPAQGWEKGRAKVGKQHNVVNPLESTEAGSTQGASRGSNKKMSRDLEATEIGHKSTGLLPQAVAAADSTPTEMDGLHPHDRLATTPNSLDKIPTSQMQILHLTGESEVRPRHQARAPQKKADIQNRPMRTTHLAPRYHPISKQADEGARLDYFNAHNTTCTNLGPAQGAEHKCLPEQVIRDSHSPPRRAQALRPDPPVDSGTGRYEVSASSTTLGTLGDALLGLGWCPSGCLFSEDKVSAQICEAIDINLSMMMMIAFITIKSSLVPLIEGLCAQIYFRFEISVVCSHLLLFFFVKEKTC